MEVEKLMTRGVRTCGPSDTMNRAAQIMWENDCGVVPVVDGDGKPVAMITDRDIAMAAFLQGKALSDMPVSVASSHGVVKVRDHDTIEIAEALMQEHQIRRVPVVDAQDRLVGVLAMSDLARSFQVAEGAGPGVTHREVAKTLAAVSQPHREPGAAQTPRHG
jgi:CBS domain-containing protein